MRMLPYGPRAVLAEFDGLDEVMAAAAAWEGAGWPGVVDVVPAARTVLVVHDGTFDTTLLEAPVEPAQRGAGSLVTLEIVYDGVDLPDVADHCGWSIDEVIRRHSSVEHTVAFCGFMPGFAYMVGLPQPLHVPRRATPRERVPAGSVAIAAGFTGIYPRQSPGGWHLVGHTSAVLWDDTAERPALLAPGTRVRFTAR